ncbi:MAG: DUF177 domain-containing protein [Candidatus Schekmanbacteria bacterium]|nr:DUF177 domain-containing protein [Candidatus Schekmanbacteria bacterium]
MSIANRLKIVLDNIPDEGLHIHEEMDAGCFEDIDVNLKTPVELDADVYMSGSIVVVTGSVVFSAELDCSRCLKRICSKITSPFKVEYKRYELRNESSDVELESEELEVDYLKEDFIDLQDLASQQIILSIPMKPLCSADCKGLCAVCGADRNENDCGCIEKKIDPRLSVLAELKKNIN